MKALVQSGASGTSVHRGMQVVSLAPVPVASMVWRLGDDPWTLSVVCKITLRLQPGTARLAKSHDPIHERDLASSVATGRVHAPADLIPLRTAVDVTLVGDAFGYGVVGPAVARLAVGDIDRSFQIEPGGGSCPAPLELAPLAASSHERGGLLSSAGPPALDGAAMTLPVGFELDYFSAAPAEQRLEELDPGAHLLLEHLHPDIAKLETRLPNVSPQVFVQRGRKREERPAIIDALWIDSRRALATLSWRCLIPLSARDESGRVWVTVAGPGRRMSPAQLSDLIRELGGRDEGEETGGELLDDDDDPMGRTVAIPAHRPPPPPSRPKDSSEATIPTNLETSGRHTSAIALGAKSSNAEPAWLKRSNRKDLKAPKRRTKPPSLPPPRPPPPPTRPPPGPPVPSKSMGPAAAAGATGPPEPTGPSGAAGAVGAVGAAPGATAPAGPSGAPGPAGPISPWGHPDVPPPPLRDAKLEDTASLPMNAADQAQKSLAAASKSLLAAMRTTAPVPPKPPAPGAAPPGGPAPSPPAPPAPGGPTSSPPAASSPGASSPSGAVRGGAPIGPAPSPPAPSPSFPAPTPPVPGSLLQSKMAQSSTAAAKPKSSPGASGRRPSRPAPARKRVAKRRPARPIDMLWHDRGATMAMRKRWQKQCTELDFSPPDPVHDLPTDDPQQARDHHIHFGILTQIEPVDRGGLRVLLQQSVSEDGRFTPPLCALDGELRVSFDAIEGLRALVGAVKPFATDDRKLESAIEDVTKLLDDSASTSQTLMSGRRHVREAFSSSKRATTLDVLDQAVDRTLLEQRKYDRRTLLGGSWIRAILKWGKSEVVCYLHEDLQTRLPMMMSFDARVLGEAHPRQDQFETPPYALRVITLGRFIRF